MSYRLYGEKTKSTCHAPRECRGECAQPASDYGDGVSGRMDKQLKLKMLSLAALARQARQPQLR